MSRAREVLDEYRRVDAAAREEVGRLLAPAGLEVTEMVRDGEGWRLRLVDAVVAGHVSSSPVPSVVPVVRAAARSTGAAEALVREGGESLMSLVSRAGNRLRVSETEGPGGLRAAAAGAVERIAWLGGTLVGDTVLALRHLGRPEDGDDVVGELHRQLRLFRQESERLLGTDDPAPFLAAVDRWMPPAFPRGAVFLARAEEVAHA